MDAVVAFLLVRRVDAAVAFLLVRRVDVVDARIRAGADPGRRRCDATGGLFIELGDCFTFEAFLLLDCTFNFAPT